MENAYPKGQNNDPSELDVETAIQTLRAPHASHSKSKEESYCISSSDCDNHGGMEIIIW